MPVVRKTPFGNDEDGLGVAFDGAVLLVGVVDDVGKFKVGMIKTGLPMGNTEEYQLAKEGSGELITPAIVVCDAEPTED